MTTEAKLECEDQSCPRCLTPMRIVLAEERAFQEHICLRTQWRFWHTPACCKHLEDPGATCICPPKP